MFTLNNFYKSKQWETFRNIIIAEKTNKTDGIIYCEHCGKPIVNKYDLIVHHIIELTDANVNNAEIALNPENVMCIHFKCHNKIHERFEGFKQQVYLVYGAPCAGKSTWVNEIANADDLILDIDKIWECISISDKYHKGTRLKANVFGLRDALLDQIKTRTGMWRAAYIIGGYPLRTDRDRLCNLLGAKPIFIDTTIDECLSRAQNKDWEQHIYDWFDSYTE